MSKELELIADVLRGRWMPPAETAAHVVSRLSEHGYSIVPSAGVEYAACYANDSGDVFRFGTSTAVRRDADRDVIRIQEEEDRLFNGMNRFFVGERHRTKWAAAAAEEGQ